MEIYDKTITEQSCKDMEKFLHFANSIGEVPLLFGGWAVHQFNPYAGSKDVDFAVSDKSFDKCVDYLVKKEGYTLKAGRLIKGEIFFDIYKRSDDLSGLKFDILYNNSEQVYLRGTHYEVLLPCPWALLYFKIHALLGRNIRKDASDSIVILLKFTEKDFERFRGKLTDKMRMKLEMLKDDADAMTMIMPPTKKNRGELKKRIKKLIG